MKNSQSGFTIIEVIVSLCILGIIGTVAGLILVQFTGLHINTGKGEHTGFVTAVERSGVVWKTGTVYVKTDLSSSQEDKYCVTDDAVYLRLEEASRNKEKLTLQHKSYFATGIYECGSEEAIVYGIK